MKKLFLLPLALTCTTLLSAQTTETKLFTGDTTPSMFSYMDMDPWSLNQLATEGDYVNFGTASAPAFTEVTDNPDKTGLNTTAKSLHLTSLKGHSWWPDFLEFTLSEPITITNDNRYLHFYHYRENLNQGFSVNLNCTEPQQNAAKGTLRFDMNLATPGKWQDVVVDLKYLRDNNIPLSSICILMDMNWGGGAEPVTNYYFDEVVLNNSNLPRGINILTDSTMSLFYGNSASYTKWVNTLDPQNTENKDTIVTNPFTTQMTTLDSPKVLEFDKSANASWWQGPRTVLTGVLPVGVNGATNYLHVMVNIPTMDNTMDYYVVQLNAKDFSGNQIDSGDNIKYWSTYAGSWVDCVMDVTSLGYVQEFTVRFDVRRDANLNYINSPAGTFYMDAASIDTNPDQRTVVTAPTAVNSPRVNGDVKTYSANKTIFVEGTNLSSVEIYSVVGKLVYKSTSAMNRYEFPMNQSGIYVVKAMKSNGNQIVNKVILR